MSLLKRFREGVAAALYISPRHVHINRLNERSNGIELYVSSNRPGATEPLPAEEVIQSLNINTLHRSLGHFGITEVSSEKNVLQDQHERDNIWTKEGVFAAVIFLTIFIIIITCLMVLYRRKEKVEYSDRQTKEQSVFPSRDLHLTPVTVPPPVPLHAVGAQTQPQVPFSSSMVQAEPAPPSTPTSIPPPRACRPPPTTPVPIPVSSSSCGPPQLPPAHQKPCLSASPSPFRMKSAACLQE
ncbi:receptor-type tyrosine-protein phosphatase R-like, partial [Oncorhynchus masou masou]|uniref:receptor-type tyrosine-protein phosphatase R-like n=1 Tax=Oncorhynchus masou masou TaxID=90313 RepID=UPI0031832D28